jgi:hypothetical protein
MQFSRIPVSAGEAASLWSGLELEKEMGTELDPVKTGVFSVFLLDLPNV